VARSSCPMLLTRFRSGRMHSPLAPHAERPREVSVRVATVCAGREDALPEPPAGNARASLPPEDLGDAALVGEHEIGIIVLPGARPGRSAPDTEAPHEPLARPSSTQRQEENLYGRHQTRAAHRPLPLILLRSSAPMPRRSR
jgi:hypothetical protein